MATRRPSLTPYAQKLRRNMTPEEIKLWTQFLRGLPVRARRQHPIGPYIVDFYIAATKTAIEVDGSQHYEDVGRAKDAARDAYLNKMGIRVLRYTNLEVDRYFHVVCEDIWNKMGLNAWTER
ncbi:MAG: endonuclease domain-containing protein [Oscillospiraceae bacterium]|nr:endonuclease domain-containing protein [Oscillospiraceae bacterium]MBR6095528.1 endonuclease domain-containing protein [Oscillospiraceae bacterium]